MKTLTKIAEQVLLQWNDLKHINVYQKKVIMLHRTLLSRTACLKFPGQFVRLARYVRSRVSLANG